MQLDFITLYVVILLNSLSLAIVWAAISVVYRNFPAARYWLGALVMTTIGGALLALEGSDLGRVFLAAGNVLMVSGFCLMWTGIRVFFGLAPRWHAILLIAALTIGATIAAGEERAALNVVFAISQMVPIGLAMFNLLDRKRRSLGAVVAAGAMALALAGHGAEAGSNILRLVGRLSTEGYYSVAAFFLVAVVVGASVWNLGFLLMAIDRLRAELAALALVDDLTGLPNRRQFLEAAAHLEAQGRRTGRGFSILLIDLDNLKEINDNYGHAAGDACLKHVADIALPHLPASTLLARLGGDEFCAIFPAANLDAAGNAARELVEALATHACHWRGHAIRVSISVGAAEWRPDGDGTVSTTLEEADTALYQTKRAGRNVRPLPLIKPTPQDRQFVLVL